MSKIANNYDHYTIYTESGQSIANTVYGKENATAIEALPELAEKLREAINILEGTAAWLAGFEEPVAGDLADNIRKWVAEHGQPTMDKAEGKP